jgi:hypothetical protein
LPHRLLIGIGLGPLYTPVGRLLPAPRNALQGNAVVNLGDALDNFLLLGHAVALQLYQVLLQLGLDEPALLGRVAVGIEHLQQLAGGRGAQVGGAAFELIYNERILLL